MRDSHLLRRRNAVTSLLVLGLILPTRAALGAPVQCPPCPNGTQEVTINIQASDVVSNVLWEVAADRYFSAHAPDGVPLGARHTITRAADLSTAFVRAAQNCQRIKQLTFFSHGSPGAIYFNGDALSPVNIPSILQGADCAMAENARLDLSGCNSGRGCRGEDFLMSLAGTLLTKGGTIAANTYYSSTVLPGVIPHTSLNGDRQILNVGRGPSGGSRWDNNPMPAQNCATRATNAARELDQLLSTYSCNMPADVMGDIRGTRDALLRVAATESAAGYDRVGFDPAHQATQATLHWSYNNFEFYSENAPSRYRSCRAPDPRDYESRRPPGGLRAY